jgi:putative tricarboxylic transport membrane protein
MSPIEGFLYGLGLSLSPDILIAALVAGLAGTLIGVLPGLGPVAGASLLLPITFAYEPAIGIILIMGVYMGAQYGGSTTSILLGIPGEASAIPATFDGFPMAKKGRAGPALVIVAIGAFIASTLSLLAVTFSAPFVSQFATKFTSVEFFALTAGGLFLLARISGAQAGAGIGASLLPMFVGLGLAMVGTDPTQGSFRFTFGQIDLSLGFDLASVAVGLYGISELIMMLEEKISKNRARAVKLRELVPSKSELRQASFPWVRGSVIGFLMGLLPIPSATMSAFTSYRVEQSISKTPERFGKGAVQGLAGPEAANAAAAVGSMVPVLMLGLPFSATLAIAIAALIVQGIQPGPLLVTQQPELFWTVIASLFIVNIVLFILNVPLVSIWVRVLRTPRHILLPIIVVFAMIGSFSVNNNMIDVYVMLAMGVVGYFFRKLGFGLAALLVGLVIGPLIEKYFLQSMLVSHGDISYLISTPVAAIIWIAVVASIVWSAISGVRKRRRRVKDGQPVALTTIGEDE